MRRGVRNWNCWVRLVARSKLGPWDVVEHRRDPGTVLSW